MFTLKNSNILIMLAAGAYFTYRGFRSASFGQTRPAKVFRASGPILIAIALLLLVLNQLLPPAVMKSTDDDFASAMFPAEPSRDASPGTVAGLSVSHITYKYSDPRRNICLILSRSQILDPEKPDDERIESLLTYLTHDARLISREKVSCGNVRGYQLELNSKGTPPMVTIIRFAFANTNFYRAIATFPKQVGETDPEIKEFIESFRAGR